MTRSVIRLETTAEDHRIAQLAAAAIGLALIDAAIPLPLPGVKPGLANIVTLIVLARYGWATAAWALASPTHSTAGVVSLRGDVCRPRPKASAVSRTMKAARWRTSFASSAWMLAACSRSRRVQRSCTAP